MTSPHTIELVKVPSTHVIAAATYTKISAKHRRGGTRANHLIPESDYHSSLPPSLLAVGHDA